MNGFAIVYALAGGLLAYSGIKGATIADTVKAVFSGNLSGLSDTEMIGTPSINVSNPSSSDSGSTSGPSGPDSTTNPGAAANQALAKKLAIQMGNSDWTTGTNWSDWVKLWNQESGWSTTAANPTSNARGIAQNINGWSSSYPEDNPTAQIEWGINYIAQRYGSPAMAWAHEQANNWY